ncbi:SET domain-containing protein SmydA-8-like [Pectinophora gossypiella]|uniref:SET domain-containing protein SmydA-8-like n=1 Tax=Pectinophora gossypiella TaxID=13191 RepID=UPI00214F5357|nr:SET domain-containing protein SmydA-8-like [Pectinophora gossypiella]
MDKKREIPLCEVCHQPANQTCGGCKLVYYCSKAHQKLGWREGHKFKCCAFKIQYSDTLGRHMVATRDIKQGEMILKEKPAAIGPKMTCPASCLSCGKKLEPIKFGDVYDFYKCTSCNWPMCGPHCEKADVHKGECKIMTDRKYRCNIKYESPDKPEAAYCVIAPLRVLLMKESNPLQYENIMNLESHLDDRINTPLYVVLKANLVTFVIQVLGLACDEETILKVASIFDTNSFDVRSPDTTKRLRAIYVTASMMDHSCKPNTRHIILGDDYNVAFIATVPIAKGELITTTYTQSLWGTLDRRKHLRTTKCFDCECDRCKDPTELGTHLGNIYCSLCNGASGMTGAMLMSSDPLDETAIWKCEKCEHYIQSRQMFWGNNALKQDLNKIDKTSPRGFEEFIQKYSQTLHPNNHLVVQAKLALIQIYGNYKGYTLSDLSEGLLKRKIDLCHEMLELADKLEPGFTRFRGTLLLDLQAAMTIQTKREFEAEKITKAGAQDQLMQSMALLQEATNILRVEPHMRDSLEAKIMELSRELDLTSDDSETLSID